MFTLSDHYLRSIKTSRQSLFQFLFTVFISLPTPLSNASLSEFETWALLCSYVLIHNYQIVTKTRICSRVFNSETLQVANIEYAIFYVHKTTGMPFL